MIYGYGYGMADGRGMTYVANSSTDGLPTRAAPVATPNADVASAARAPLAFNYSWGTPHVRHVLKRNMEGEWSILP
jgi:hypothetical protein